MRLITIEEGVNKRRKIFYKILFFPFTIKKTRLYISNLDKVGGENAFPIDKRGERGIESIHRIKIRGIIMKYALRGITAEELSYTINRIKMDKDTKFEIKPQFSRTVRRVQENDKLWFLTLEVKVESTEEAPKPFDLKVRLVGVFEAEDLQDDLDRHDLVINMTEVVYPYLRAAVSSLTANAFINPMMLPVIPAGTMFPEDRGEAPQASELN